MTKIKIVQEPFNDSRNYAREAWLNLVLLVDETASNDQYYAVKFEIAMAELEKKDFIGYGWWKEHFWPPKSPFNNWIYFPKECCEEIL